VRVRWIVAIAITCFARTASAAPGDAPLVVGVIPSPPFVVEHADGSWGGISLELWARVAREIGVEYTLSPLAPGELAPQVASGAYDVVLSINITERAETLLDLSHAFYSTGLAIAVRARAGGGVVATVGRLLSSRIGLLVGALLGVLLGVGLLMWLVERRGGSDLGAPARRGLRNAVWWSTVTMAKGESGAAPATRLGRALARGWTFAGVLLVSAFTAAVSSALTVEELRSTIGGPDDLPGARIGAIERTAGARYCARRQLAYAPYRDVDAALAALARGDVDAVVHEAPLVRHAIRAGDHGALRVLSGTFDNHGYGIGLRTSSELREVVDRAILRFTATDEWTELLARHLGA
jgi:ABC-type amino acid transport substrate-binding protein